MNRYYLVVLDLYKESRYKRTMKEVWGDKLYIVYGIFAGLGIGSLGVVSGIFVSIYNNRLGSMISVVSYIFLMIVALSALFFTRSNKNEAEQRKNWLKEIDQFNNLLVEYKFKNQDIERMILYIDEYRTRRIEQRKRKYDIMWGIVSVTILSFIVSVGKSIWDSYGFVGDEAFQIGGLLILAIFIIAISLLMVISVAYDLYAKAPKDEDGLEKALQEVLFRRSVEMLVETEIISYELIEKSYRS